MAEMVSPGGTRATVPDDMVPALTARGWYPTEEAKPKRAPKKPVDPKPADTE